MVATIGFFDGVHKGHLYLLQSLIDEARRRQDSAMVITFLDHPRRVLRKDYIPELLSSNTEKEILLSQAGVDEVVFLEFNEDFSHLTAYEFMKTYLRDRLGVNVLLMGYDHHFGCDPNETIQDIQRHGAELGIEVLPCDGFRMESTKVSSTTIRRALKTGDLKTARECLGYDYSITGIIVEGHQVGRCMGFPTANIHPSNPDKLLPACGVYAIHAEVGAQRYGGVLNIGHRPTLNNGNNLSIEAHLFDFEGNLYGKTLTVSLVARLRDELRFESREDLQQQIHADVSMAKRILATQ